MCGKRKIVFTFSDLCKQLTKLNNPGNSAAATCRTSVGQQTVALVSSHIIDAGALVEAGVGGTLVDVSLTVRSYGGRIREHTWG